MSAHLMKWLPTRELTGSIATFSGAFLATTFSAFAIFSGMELFEEQLRAHWHVSRADLRQDCEAVVFGAVLYLVGRTLRPGAISQFGYVLTAVGFLWLALTGVCYYLGYDPTGFQRAIISLGTLPGSIAVATGQMQRRP